MEGLPCRIVRNVVQMVVKRLLRHQLLVCLLGDLGLQVAVGYDRECITFLGISEKTLEQVLGPRKLAVFLDVVVLQGLPVLVRLVGAFRTLQRLRRCTCLVLNWVHPHT